MRANEFITELAYHGNIGMMELAKFFSVASPAEKIHLKKLIADKNYRDAWKYFQRVVGVKLQEGGWASEKTQNTVITPQLVATVRKILAQFEQDLNAHLDSKNIPHIGIGHPAGSGTYYERDLKINPTREYGDVDVMFFVPRIPEMTNNQVNQLFASNVKEFCDASADYSTSNGKNVIIQIGDNDYVQVDLVTAYFDMADWSKALAPEYNVKGVLCASLYSALAEVLQLSIGSNGVQAKTVGDEVVPFRTIKGTTLHTVSASKDTWAVDIVKFFGGNTSAPLLRKYPGWAGETRVSDIINSIKGIAQGLGQGDLPSKVKAAYLKKIDAVINSSKFDKAATPAAVAKAEHTKELLAQKSAEIAAKFD